MKGNGLVIPYKSYGANAKNYRIVAVPLHLDDDSIRTIMYPHLQEYDKRKWRMHTYINDGDKPSTTEYKNGLETVKPGRGYWFVIKDSTESNKTIYSGKGRTVDASIESPFSVDVQKGWNQIGNPYNIALRISDIKNYKKNTSYSTSEWYKWEGAYNNGDTLNTMQGALMYAEKSGKLYFPTTKVLYKKQNNEPGQALNLRAGLRIGNETELEEEQDNWKLNLKLQTKEQSYHLASIGMHEGASESKDKFDHLTPPRFIDYLELGFPHPEYAWNSFTSDIVPVKESHIFTAQINSEKEGIKTLSWNENTFKDKEKKLYLYDSEKEKVIDMSLQSTYVFESKQTRTIKFYYGDEYFIAHALKPNSITLSAPVPNPFSESTSMSVSLPKDSASNEAYSIDLSVYNSFGQKVATLANGSYPTGFYKFDWNGYSASGIKEASGLYVIKLKVESNGVDRVITRKVVVR